MFSLSDQDTLPVTYHTPTGVFLFGEDGVQVSADTTVYEKQTDDSLPSLTSQDIEHLQEGGYPDTSDSPEAPDTESGSALCLPKMRKIRKRRCSHDTARRNTGFLYPFQLH